MPFEPKTLFPGLLADSAARLAQDAAGRYPERPVASLTGEMGWSAVLVAEEQGGVGGNFTDLASIIEALASHAVDLPVITRCGIVPAMLNTLHDNDRARALLAGSADGSAVVELGGPLCPSDHVAPLSARRGPQGWQVSGATAEMSLTEDCTHVLLVCRNTGDDTPLLISVDSGSLRRQAMGFHTMDDCPVQACTLEDLALADRDVVASGPDAQRALQAGWRVAVACKATDIVSGMGSALARTVQYLLERQQFGQPLAQFQALRHEVARLYVTYELARNLLQASLRALQASASGEGDAGAFDLLGLYTGQEAILFAESVIQLHGGMGMTREMPAARLATRLLANACRFGDPLSHHQSLNQLRDGTLS